MANRSRKTQDLFARQKNTLRGFEKATQDLLILNLRQTITQRLEKRHSVQQERREGFTDDNDAVYAELQRQLARPTEGQTSRARRTPFDLRVQDPVAQNSQDVSQETDASIDFGNRGFWIRIGRVSTSRGWSQKERAGRPMILIHQVAYPSA